MMLIVFTFLKKLGSENNTTVSNGGYYMLFLCAFVSIDFCFHCATHLCFCLFYFSFAMVHCCVYLLCITFLHELSLSLV